MGRAYIILSIVTVLCEIGFAQTIGNRLSPQISNTPTNNSVSLRRGRHRQKRFELDLVEGVNGNRLNASQWQKEIESMLASGSWTGSGGDGVACFENEAIAKLALDSKGQLKAGKLQLIKELHVLDYYEFKNRLTYRTIPHKFQRRRMMRDFNRRFQKRTIRKLSPLLSMELRSLRREIPVSSWKKLPSIPTVADSGKIRVTIPKNCQIVQMALRLSPKSGSNKLPMVFVNRSLFKLLRRLNTSEVAILNQSMLIMHEKLYLLASRVGHYDSSKVRKLVALLFSTRIQKLIQKQRSGGTAYASFFKILEKLDLDEFYYLASIRSKGQLKTRLVPELIQGYLKNLKSLKKFLNKNKYRVRQLVRNEDIIKVDFVSEVASSLSTAEAFLLSTIVFDSYGHVERYLFKRNRFDRDDQCDQLTTMSSPSHRDQAEILKLAQVYCQTR